MARERLRLRYGNEIAGVFVLVAMGALIFFITEIAESREGWAKGRRQLEYTVILPEAGAYGLKIGSQVHVLGAEVGSVRDIQFEGGVMRAEIAISDKFAPVVTSESKIELKKEFGVAGDTYLEISRGAGSPLEERATLRVEAEDRPEFEEIAKQMVKDIRDQALPTLADVRKAAQEYTKLAAGLTNPDGELQRLLANLRVLTDTMREGEGTVGRLIKDPDVADRLRGLVEQTDRTMERGEAFLEELREGAVELKEAIRNIRAETEEAPGLVLKAQKILDEMQDVMANMRAATARLPEVTEKAEKGLDTLPGLLLQTQATLREMERFVEALQRHWLVSRYVDKAPPGRISPAEAGGKR